MAENNLESIDTANSELESIEDANRGLGSIEDANASLKKKDFTQPVQEDTGELISESQGLDGSQELNGDAPSIEVDPLVGIGESIKKARTDYLSGLKDSAELTKFQEQEATKEIKDFTGEEFKGSMGGAIWNELAEGFTKNIEDASTLAMMGLALTMPETAGPDVKTTKEAMERIAPAIDEMAVKETLDKKLKTEDTSQEYINRIKDESFLTEAGLGLAASIYPMTTPQMSGFFTTGFVEGYRDIDEKYPDLSPEAKAVYGGAQGSMILLLEKAGLYGVAKNSSAVKSLTNKFLSESAQEKIKDLGSDKAIKLAAKIVNGFAAEAETGAVQYAGEEAIKQSADLLQGEDKFEFEGTANFIKGMARAGALEGIGGGIISSAHASVGLIKDVSSKREAEALVTQNESISIDVQNPEVSDEAKEALGLQLKENTEEIFSVVAEDQAKEEKLSKEQKEKIVSLEQEAEIQQAVIIDPAVSQESKSMAERKVREIESNINTIRDEKTTTETIDTKVATEVTPTPKDDIKDIVKTKPKLEKDAIQKQEPKSVDVREQAKDGKTVVEGDTKREEPAKEGEKEKEVEFSGIKKSLIPESVQEKIKAKGWDIVSDKDMEEIGALAVKSKEVDPKGIVKEVQTESRALQPVEVTALIYYKSTLDKELEDAYIAREKVKEGESSVAADAKIVDLEADLFEYQTASLITGQQQSLAFRLRQGLRDSNTFNSAKAIYKYKATNEGKISDKLEEEFKDIGIKVKDLEIKIKQLEVKERVREEEGDFENIVKEVEGTKKNKKFYSEKAKKTANKFRKKYKAKEQKFKIKDDNGNDIDVDLTKHGIGQNEIVELIAKAIEKTGSIADAVVLMTEQLQQKDWYKNLSKSNQKYLKKQITDGVLETEGMMPYVEDGETTVPAKLIRDIVSSGVKDIDKVVEIVREQLLEDNPNITEREIRDTITGYGKVVGRTKDEIRSEINKIKRLGKLISQEEDLKAGKRPFKTIIPNKVKESQKEKQLKNNIKSLKESLGLDQKEKLERTKKRMQKQINDFEEMIREGQFTKKEIKKLKISDDELSKLRSEREQLLDVVQKEQFKIEEANRSGEKKVADAFAEVFNALPRVLVASMDLSAMGVQGFLRMWKNPVDSALGMKESIHQLFSEKRHKEFIANIKAQPWYHMMKESKLALLESNYKLDVKEEQFLGNWINLIYDGILDSIDTVVGKNKVTKFIKAINPYKASERAYAGYLNYIRVKMFLKLASKLENQGINFQENPEHYKSAANLVNNITGRGSLGPLESSNRLLQAGFFSVRRLAATLNILNPVYYANMPKEIRKEALKEYIISIGIITAVTTAAAATIGGEDDDLFEDDFFDPNSSNFMKIKVRGEDKSFTTINLYGPLQSLAVTIYRMFSGKFRSATTGKTEILGKRYGKPVNSRWDVLVTYFANKKSPGLTFIKEHMDNRFKKQESEILKEGTTPMWTHDLEELFNDHPSLLASFLTTLNMIGVSTQHFESRKGKAKKRRERRKAERESRKK